MIRRQGIGFEVKLLDFFDLGQTDARTRSTRTS